MFPLCGIVPVQGPRDFELSPSARLMEGSPLRRQHPEPRGLLARDSLGRLTVLLSALRSPEGPEVRKRREIPCGAVRV